MNAGMTTRKDILMPRPTLAELEPGANFIRRHIGPDERATKEMLNVVGAKTLDEFIAKVVPENIRTKRPLELKKAMAERTALSYLRQVAEQIGRASCRERV